MLPVLVEIARFEQETIDNIRIPQSLKLLGLNDKTWDDLLHETFELIYSKSQTLGWCLHRKAWVKLKLWLLIQEELWNNIYLVDWKLFGQGFIELS